METALGKGEQVILFLNRRGFNTYISCPRCGFVLRCANCDVSLIYHRESDIARCHYCAYKTQPPAACPGCGLHGIKLLHGSGTERVEQEVARLFGADSVARMDTDSMKTRGSHGNVLEAFRAGKSRILLGTQMVVKGLDFPNVTLVGVINADTSIHMPDFRASERTFQFLAQVAGRTGRGPKGGRVIVQTFEPDQSCIRDAARHDYETFARRELEERKRYGYPPFTRLARLIYRGRDAAQTQKRCTEAVAALQGARAGENGQRSRSGGSAHPAHQQPVPLARAHQGARSGIAPRSAPRRGPPPRRRRRVDRGRGPGVAAIVHDSFAVNSDN